MKEIKVKIFNRELVLTERTAECIINADNLSAQAADRKGIDLWCYSLMVANSLRKNIERLYWFQPIKRFHYKIIFSPSYLRKKLSKSELLELVLKVFDLELESNKEIEQTHSSFRDKYNSKMEASK